MYMCVSCRNKRKQSAELKTAAPQCVKLFCGSNCFTLMLLDFSLPCFPLRFRVTWQQNNIFLVGLKPPTRNFCILLSFFTQPVR